MINKKALAKKSGPMVHTTKATIFKERKRARVSSLSQMVAFTTAYSRIMRSAESDTIVGPTVKHIKDHGLKIKWTDRVHLDGKMENHMKVNFSMISVKEKVNLCGQTDASI